MNGCDYLPSSSSHTRHHNPPAIPMSDCKYLLHKFYQVKALQYEIVFITEDNKQCYRDTSMPPSVPSGTTFWRSCMESPRYNRTGWLGVKHQFTSYMEPHTTYKAHWLRKVATVTSIVGPIKHYRGERVPGKLQALVYDIRNSFGGRCRKAMLGVWVPGQLGL